MADFKICRVCGMSWNDRDAFLSDPAIELTGYQVSFIELRTGLFLFNHDCGNTLAVEVWQFRELYAGPVFTTRLTGTSECPGHCLNSRDLGPCPKECECAYVREVLGVVNRRLQSVRGGG